MSDKFETMSDIEVTREAALLMGWKEQRPDLPYILHFTDNEGRTRDLGCGDDYEKFSPLHDLNHAAEFGAAFLAKWPQTHISVRVGVGGVDCAAYGYDGYAICMIYSQASEPRARTLVILRAWVTLNG